LTGEVEDSDGFRDSTSVFVEVSDTDHDPTVRLRITQLSGVQSGTTGTVGTTYRFFAETRDLDDTQNDLQVRWDFDGDSKFDTPFTKQKSAQHTYFDPGRYTVMVEVLDTSGATSQDSEEIMLVSNTAPRVSITVEPVVGTPGTVFEIRVVNLLDDQYRRSSLETRFDFEGDSVFDTKFAHSTRVTHTYSELGEKKIVVQARDPQGSLSEDSVTVRVVSSTPPKAVISVSPSETGTFSTAFVLDGSRSFDREVPVLVATNLDDAGAVGAAMLFAKQKA